ncbi:lysozyme inhibitor LprI family protein [Paraburkholderia sp. J41]|uniref:lysozyme inhibitor LprI family protein n=1 Tax=Paraburkholderia sp. J41 TaxID=2805433 RepID=UPI002AC3536C|nr:lysozyme inhibitor LprI family protein [Paraburkholderia sp. J41]
MKRLFLTLAAISFAGGAYAAGCAKPRNAFDDVYCSGNLFAQVDHDLNSEYATLQKRLSTGQQAMLKRSQVSWIRQRDAACSETKESGFFVNLDCAVDMTQQRLAFLRERERECNSTGCAESKLGQ